MLYETCEFDNQSRLACVAAFLGGGGGRGEGECSLERTAAMLDARAKDKQGRGK